MDEETRQQLSVAVSTVREAMLRWDADALLIAAERLESIKTSNAEAAFYRDLWRGTACFHAVLAAGHSQATQTMTSIQDRAHPLAVAALNQALRVREDESNAHAMLSVLHGLSISERPLRALQLGPRLMSHRKAAANQRAKNPRVSYLEGVSQYHRATKRADISASLKRLLEAEALFAEEAAREPPPLSPDWGRGPNRLFIGEAYERLGRFEEALGWFSKALETAPGMARAKNGYERCKKAMARRSS